MITPFQMYLLLMLDNICIVSLILTIVLALITFMIGGLLVSHDLNEDERNCTRKFFKCVILVFILSLLSTVFIPNTQQAATIILVPKVLNNEKVQDIGQNGLDLANNLLKLSNEYIEKNLITKEKTK